MDLGSPFKQAEQFILPLLQIKTRSAQALAILNLLGTENFNTEE
jgi:uncharacterized protein YllA (UPF0747 family)